MKLLRNNVSDLTLSPQLKDYPRLVAMRDRAERLVRAFDWKSSLPADFPVMACLLGGTGTGKSTLFNSLAGRPVSEVGMIRPCTVKAVVLVGEDWAPRIRECPCLTGDSDFAVAIPHQDETLDGVILVDTPDFDSVEAANREVCEAFFVLSDMVIFVTSQEKYADLAGMEMVEQSLAWGKRTVFVMNKVASEDAFGDFADMLGVKGDGLTLLRVERMPSAVEYIPGLAERPEFRGLLNQGDGNGQGTEIKRAELAALAGQTSSSLEDLHRAIVTEQGRIQAVNEKIKEILRAETAEMEARLELILSRDTEEHITERLTALFRKYDILFVPRMMVRNAVLGLYNAFVEMLPFVGEKGAERKDEKSYRREDLEQAKAAARLEPLESAINRLNHRIAELLATAPNADDLREVARQSVPRWDKEKIRSLYDETFPGLERLLEAEFERFRHGLSTGDELKLYGSYTAWALFLITAEIILGGGFTLLDAVLNTVIMPLIPKWLVNLKVIDVLREIGERIDRQHREALSGILARQAQLYQDTLSGLLPPDEAVERLKSVRSSLADNVPWAFSEETS